MRTTNMKDPSLRYTCTYMLTYYLLLASPDVKYKCTNRSDVKLTIYLLLTEFYLKES